MAKRNHWWFVEFFDDGLSIPFDTRREARDELYLRSAGRRVIKLVREPDLSNLRRFEPRILRNCFGNDVGGVRPAEEGEFVALKDVVALLAGREPKKGD